MGHAARRFRPTLWPTVMTIPALILLIGLGTWQVQRLHWKADILETMEARLAEAPTALPPVLDDPAAWRYRPVQVTGTFDHAASAYRLGQVERGTLGAHLLTPLQRRGDARPVLVVRGWIPDAAVDRPYGVPPTGPVDTPLGTVEVTGILHQPEQPGWFTPDNDPETGAWYWLDLPALAESMGLPAVAPLVLYAEAERSAAPADGSVGADPDDGADAARLPVPGVLTVDIPNNHLNYALTWYGLALCLVGVYVAYHLRRPDPTA